MKRVQVDVTDKHEAAAKLAVAKGVSSSVKQFYEMAVDSASIGFYVQCAALEGITIEQWMKDKDKF